VRITKQENDQGKNLLIASREALSVSNYKQKSPVVQKEAGTINAWQQTI